MSVGRVSHANLHGYIYTKTSAETWTCPIRGDNKEINNRDVDRYRKPATISHFQPLRSFWDVSENDCTTAALNNANFAPRTRDDERRRETSELSTLYVNERRLKSTEERDHLLDQRHWKITRAPEAFLDQANGNH